MYETMLPYKKKSLSSIAAVCDGRIANGIASWSFKSRFPRAKEEEEIYTYPTQD